MTLDPANDPDRYVPSDEPLALDADLDPDRYRSGSGRGGTLPEMLGEGAHEERDNLEWLYGLLGVLAFLVLVSLAINYL